MLLCRILELAVTKINQFIRDDAGAITVDWVALTFGVLLAGIVTIYAIYGTGVAGLVDEVNNDALALATDATPGPVPNINQ